MLQYGQAPDKLLTEFGTSVSINRDLRGWKMQGRHCSLGEFCAVEADNGVP